MMQQNSSGPNVGLVLFSCARSIAFVLCGLALLVGFIFAAPFIVDGVAFVWYGWARILTNNYTTVIPAALLEWGALLVGVWAICVAIKLARARTDLSLFFGIAAALLMVFAALPANCAIAAVSGDWVLPISKGHTAMECAAVITAYLFMAACCVAPFWGFLKCVTSEPSTSKHS